MSRQSVELAEDRPYPVRILQVPAVRGELLPAGEPLCIVQWADDEVQRIVLDSDVVVDTLGVRAGETLPATATLALIRPIEDAVATVGGTESKSGKSSKGLLAACLVSAAIAGFFSAGFIFRATFQPGIGLAILAGCGLGLALFLRSLRPGAGTLSFLAFGLAAVAAGVLGGRTERTTDWLSDLPGRILGAGAEVAEEDVDDGEYPALRDFPLPPVPDGMEAAGVAEPLLDRYVWSLSLCSNLDRSCVTDAMPGECADRAEALQTALPDLVPSERLEAQMQEADTPPGSAFAVGEGESCDDYLVRAESLIATSREMIADEEVFLADLADAEGHPEWATALWRLVTNAAGSYGDCNGMGRVLGDEDLKSWPWERALALHAAFPGRKVDSDYLWMSDATAKREERGSLDRKRRLRGNCEELRQNTWLALNL